jgi:hypothetical protein
LAAATFLAGATLLATRFFVTRAAAFLVTRAGAFFAARLPFVDF